MCSEDRVIVDHPEGSMSKEPKTPCETCGEPTAFPEAVRCTNCWEVESRLEKYLQSPGGQRWARNKTPLLDDWVDGSPDSWDFNTVLAVNEVKVEWVDTVVDEQGNVRQINDFRVGWLLSWKSGTMHIGDTTETIARKAAALFVSLWQRGVSASFADKLMDGFIVYLERQEGITKGIVADVKGERKQRGWRGVQEYLSLRLGKPEALQDKILRDFGLKAGDKVGVTLNRL